MHPKKMKLATTLKGTAMANRRVDGSQALINFLLNLNTQVICT